MRKIIVYNIISLDGYHTGLNNEISVLFPVMGGSAFNGYNAELMHRTDVHLIGRVSFELFHGYWPKVAENPTSEEWTDEQREMVEAGKSISTVVVSDTLVDNNIPGMRVIRGADAYQQIADLKSQPGKDILITGSRTLWNDLLAHDLVDEIHLMIGNIILGEGVPVFAGKSDVPLRLLEVRRWEGSDNVILRYEVLPKSV